MSAPPLSATLNYQKHLGPISTRKHRKNGLLSQQPKEYMFGFNDFNEYILRNNVSSFVILFFVV